MQAETQVAGVQPTPLLLQAVSKVEQVLARLQELQSSISGSQPPTTSRVNPPSCRMPHLLANSPEKSKGATAECRVSGEYKRGIARLGRAKGSNSTPERRKSLTLADGWRHWSSPAKDVHDVISEIMLANKLTKQFVNLVGSNPNAGNLNANTSKAKLKSGRKTLLDSTSDLNRTRTSVNSNPSSSEGSLLSGVPDPTLCSSVESLSTPRRRNKPVSLNTRSASKRSSTKKPPPHVFKVVVGSEGPAAKTAPASGLRSIEARKNEARKLTTPSPLYKRRSGTLVQKPLRMSGELRTSPGGQNSKIRCSIEKKRLTDSASLRRSTEKFVEACRALMEEDEKLRRANGQGKAVHFSNTPPVVIRPLTFDSPVWKVKPAKKAHKNWLTHRFSKTAAKETSLLKLKKKTSPTNDLSTLISRLPCQKTEPPAASACTEPAKNTKSVSKTELVPVASSLPLPPARQAEALKNRITEARGMALKASRDQKSGYTSYALEPTVVLTSSRESLASVDANSLKEKDKNRCSVGCPPKDTTASSNGKGNQNTATPAEIPSYMRPRAGAGSGKENARSSNTPRQSSAGLDSKSSSTKHNSGSSLLHRAKGWVNLHKTKDKNTESSLRTAVAS